MTKYEKWYEGVHNYIIKHNLSSIINRTKSILTSIIVISYIVLLVYCLTGFFCGQCQLELFLKIILVPLITFIFVSVIRYFINAERPYTKYNITPIIDKDTTGKSFPSRHTFSGCIISMAWIYVCPPIGIIVFIMAIVIAFSRVFSGVHFFRDVIAAIVFAIVFGIIGFWIL